MCVAVVQLVVDIVLDDRYLAFANQFDQRTFLFIRHLEAERILKIGHDHAGGDLMLVEYGFQCCQVYAFTWMRSDFYRAHTHTFDRVQHRVESRRLDRDDIARLTNCLQTKIDCFSRTDGNDDFIRIYCATVFQITSGDLSDQVRMTGR